MEVFLGCAPPKRRRAALAVMTIITAMSAHDAFAASKTSPSKSRQQDSTSRFVTMDAVPATATRTVVSDVREVEAARTSQANPRPTRVAARVRRELRAAPAVNQPGAAGEQENSRSTLTRSAALDSRYESVDAIPLHATVATQPTTKPAREPAVAEYGNQVSEPAADTNPRVVVAARPVDRPWLAKEPVAPSRSPTAGVAQANSTEATPGKVDSTIFRAPVDPRFVSVDAVPASPLHGWVPPQAQDWPTETVVLAANSGIPSLWAKLQDDAPAPPGQDAASSPSPSDSLPGLEPIAPGAAAGSANGQSGDISNQNTRLGEEPVNNTFQFLRRQTVLLQPGQCQFDVGVSYLIDDADFPVLLIGPPDSAAEARVKQRLLVVPFEWRMGLTDRVQGFINAPVGWSNTELSFAGIDEFSNSGGIGDTTAGLTMHLQERWGFCPDIIGTVHFTAPTGNGSLPLVPLVPQSQLGQGYWALGGNVLFIHTIDPVVVFYGMGVRHRFETDVRTDLLGQVSIEPGFETNYQFGVAFTVNERITLSTSFFGAYLADDYIDDVRLAGTSLEPLTLRFAATIAQCTRIMEPFAEIGMTDDAPSARVGIVWTY
jgi:hypothetical protein